MHNYLFLEREKHWEAINEKPVPEQRLKNVFILTNACKVELYNEKSHSIIVYILFSVFHSHE